MPAGKRFGESDKLAYLALVRTGEGVLKAARRLGWSGATVTAARRADAEFDVAVREAMDEAAEPVERVLYEAATRGEPWAVQMWLKGRLGHRGWNEKVEIAVDVSGTVEIEAGQRLEGIARLQAVLASRAQELGLGTVVDATSRVAAVDPPALGVGRVSAVEPALSREPVRVESGVVEGSAANWPKGADAPF